MESWQATGHGRQVCHELTDGVSGIRYLEAALYVGAALDRASVVVRSGLFFCDLGQLAGVSGHECLEARRTPTHDRVRLEDRVGGGCTKFGNSSDTVATALRQDIHDGIHDAHVTRASAKISGKL